MRHIILFFLAASAISTVGRATDAAQRKAHPSPPDTGLVAVEGVVIKFRRQAQHMSLPGGAGVSFDVAQVRLVRPAALAGGVMNITYDERDRSFWENSVQQEIVFRMGSEDFARLTEVLADDRQINSFTSSLLDEVKLKSPPPPPASSPFSPVTPGTSQAEIQLRGVLQWEHGHRVALWDSSRPTAPEWVAVGGAFRGFTVQSYDTARETVRLQHGATVREVRLAGARAVASRRISASKVIISEGRRLCTLHGVTLVEKKGFVAPPDDSCGRPMSAIMGVYIKYHAEFPNPFGWSISPESSPDKNVAVIREFCPRCEQAYTDRVGPIRASRGPK